MMDEYMMPSMVIKQQQEAKMVLQQQDANPAS